MRKSITVIILIGIFVVCGVLAQSGYNRSYRGFGQKSKIERKHVPGKTPFLHNSWKDVLEKRKELNLSDEQINKIKQMTFDFQTAQVDRRAVVQKARIELKRLKTDKAAIEESVMQAFDKLALAQAEVHKASFLLRNQMHSVLTDKQLEHLKEIWQERRSKMRGLDSRTERVESHEDDLEL